MGIRNTLVRHLNSDGERVTALLLLLVSFSVYLGSLFYVLANIPGGTLLNALLVGLCIYTSFAMIHRIASCVSVKIYIGEIGVFDAIKGVIKYLFLSMALQSLFAEQHLVDELMLEHHNYIVALLIGLVFAKSLMPVRMPSYSNHHEIAYGIPAKRFKIDEEVRKQVCYHEAGHALVIAAIPGALRIVASVSAYQYMRDDGTQGQVQWVPTDLKMIGTEDYMSIRMLVGLGGLMAERHVFGEHGNGGNSDLENWISEAKAFHRVGFGGFYYVKPENGHEQHHNTKVLATLRRRHSLLLTEFMIMNETLLEELSDRLMEQTALSGDQLEELLVKVKFPRGFPVYKPQVSLTKCIEVS